MPPLLLVPLMFRSRDVFRQSKSGEDGQTDQADIDYSTHANQIAMKAKMALVKHQIAETERAKNTIAKDFMSADAQLMLAEVSRQFHAFLLLCNTFNSTPPLPIVSRD